MRQIDIKILRPFTGTGAVFFPIGPPPKGTCEYATKECMEKCYVKRSEYPDFDEELLVPELEKRKVYEHFIRHPVKEICGKILAELDGLQTPILHWFGSGDCLSKDTETISAIIDAMDKSVVQMGFTRNKRLWKRHLDVFALTIESEAEATDKVGMYAVPNYGGQVSVMYNPSYQVRGGHCGPITCRDSYQVELEHYINCRTCMRLKTGCFDRRDIKEEKVRINIIYD